MKRFLGTIFGAIAVLVVICVCILMVCSVVDFIWRVPVELNRIADALEGMVKNG